jgi:ribosomal protein S18 acetylase RimI-like enzyme
MGVVVFATEALSAADAEFDACYALMQATFPADVLVNRAEYGALLQAPASGTHPHWFAMLARWEQATRRLVGMVAGSYMRLNESRGLVGAQRAAHSIGMIEYLAIAPDAQQQGHGRALLTAFEEQMQAFAGQRGESLMWLVGEVDDDLLPFKFHLGYGLPTGLRYVQPPIEFDAAGEPCFAAVPKHLALKPMAQSALMIEADVLQTIIQTMYRWRYVPVLEDDVAQKQAAAYLEQHITPPVLASIGAGMIPLRQTIMPDA